MPSNGVGDRVHNFFAQENLPQGLLSQDGNFPLNVNLWAGNQKQFGVSDSSPRNYNSQQPETERGNGSQHVPDPHIFNITRPNVRPEFARSLSQSHHEQPSSNGYMYGGQNLQTRPNEANRMGIDTKYGRNNVNQRGFPIYESQQEPFPDQTSKNPFRSESSEAHGSFDLFGGQHQTNSQLPGLMQQPLQQQQQQQSGFGDMQHLQQQLMLRKMQELQRKQESQRQHELQRQQESQRQHELQRQEDISQQNSLNQASHFARQQSAGNHSHGLVNGTSSDSFGHGWTEPAAANPNPNPNWLHRASTGMQPDQGQPQRPMGFVNQQAEPSLYVSSSKEPLSQFPCTNSFPDASYVVTPEQNIVRDKGLFGNTFGQGSNTGMKMDHMQQVNTLQNIPVQGSHAAQVQDNSATNDASSLDPEEEKILFGSDDNIWEAFGSSKNMTVGVSGLLDDNDFASRLPSSMQSGSWSALMQSAVAETTSEYGGCVGVHEEWPDLNSQNAELPHGKHPYEDSGKHQTQTALSDKHHSNMGFQHHAKNNPYEKMNQPSSGGSNWLNRGALQNSMPGQRTPQQHGTSQPNNKQIHWNANESVPPSVNTGFNISQNESENLSQQYQNNDRKRIILNNTAAIPNLSNLQKGGNHSNQFFPNNHHPNYWKHVDSSVKSKGSENSEISCSRLNNKGPQVSESSFNSSDKEDLNSSIRENSNDSYRSSSSHRPMSVGQQGQFSSDVGDSRSLAGTKQSLSNQAAQKFLGLWKFQYHPMGNLEEDVGVPYGTRQGTNTKPVSLQHSQGTFVHTKTSGQGYIAEVEGVPKGSDDMRFKGMNPGHMSNIFATHDRSVGLSTSDKASQPSQNMLDLLHKVDHSRDGGIPRHLNSLEHNLSSEIPEPENSDGSFGGSHQRSHSSNSQGIGLQLGPPSQRLPVAMQAAVKHNSLSQPQSSANPRGNAHVESQSESQNTGHKMTNLSAALGTESFIERTQIRQADEPHGRSSSSGLYDNFALSERLQVSQSLTGEKLPASHPRGNPGVPQQGAFPKMLPNAWSNLQSEQLFVANQARNGQLNIVESASLGQQQHLNEREAEKKGNNLPKFGASSLSSQGGITSVGDQSTEKVGRGQTMNGPAAGNDSISVPLADASHKDLEAFGRSLKPNNFHQQISLMNQIKAFKNTDNELNNRLPKRLKVSDNLLPGQQVTAPPGISEKPRSTGPTDSVERSLASLSAYPPLKDVLASNQNGSQSGIPVKIEQTDISPQMAPSWFDQHGTFKSGQMSQRDAVRSVEQQPFNAGKVSGILETPHDSKELVCGAADTGQGGVIWKTQVPVAVDKLTSNPLQTNICVQNVVAVRPKKRKWSRDDIHSWLKEVSGSSKNPQGICTASMEWCGATNRMMLKVDGDGEVIEDIPRSKRRIIVATQLMQQLFPPPPTSLLSTDAISSYESVVFYVARMALGDTCNLVSCVSKSYLSTDKSKESERIDALEECIRKENKMERYFTRLDKKASILDLRTECQELEGFSINNRYGKFYRRGQRDGKALSSSDAANTPKPTPQRYALAVRLPKNLPVTVQCMPL